MLLQSLAAKKIDLVRSAGWTYMDCASLTDRIMKADKGTSKALEGLDHVSLALWSRVPHN